MTTIDEILENIRKDVKKRFNDKYEILGIIRYSEVDFNDGSLGLPAKGQSYIQIIIPGYKIECDVLERANGNRIMLLYHTDRTGTDIRFNPNPASKGIKDIIEEEDKLEGVFAESGVKK